MTPPSGLFNPSLSAVTTNKNNSSSAVAAKHVTHPLHHHQDHHQRALHQHDHLTSSAASSSTASTPPTVPARPPANAAWSLPAITLPRDPPLHTSSSVSSPSAPDLDCAAEVDELLEGIDRARIHNLCCPSPHGPGPAPIGTPSLQQQQQTATHHHPFSSSVFAPPLSSPPFTTTTTPTPPAALHKTAPVAKTSTPAGVTTTPQLTALSASSSSSSPQVTDPPTPPANDLDSLNLSPNLHADVAAASTPTLTSSQHQLHQQLNQHSLPFTPAQHHHFQQSQHFHHQCQHHDLHTHDHFQLTTPTTDATSPHTHSLSGTASRNNNASIDTGSLHEQQAQQLTTAPPPPPHDFPRLFKVFPCPTRAACEASGDTADCFYHHSPSVDRRRVDTDTYKPHMCRFVDGGAGCRKGDTCPFAHNDFERRYHPDRFGKETCRDFLRGDCPRRFCTFRHHVSRKVEVALTQLDAMADKELLQLVLKLSDSRGRALCDKLLRRFGHAKKHSGWRLEGFLPDGRTTSTTQSSSSLDSTLTSSSSTTQSSLQSTSATNVTTTGAPCGNGPRDDPNVRRVATRVEAIRRRLRAAGEKKWAATLKTSGLRDMMSGVRKVAEEMRERCRADAGYVDTAASEPHRLIRAVFSNTNWSCHSHEGDNPFLVTPDNQSEAVSALERLVDLLIVEGHSNCNQQAQQQLQGHSKKCSSTTGFGGASEGAAPAAKNGSKKNDGCVQQLGVGATMASTTAAAMSSS